MLPLYVFPRKQRVWEPVYELDLGTSADLLLGYPFHVSSGVRLEAETNTLWWPRGQPQRTLTSIGDYLRLERKRKAKLRKTILKRVRNSGVGGEVEVSEPPLSREDSRGTDALVDGAERPPPRRRSSHGQSEADTKVSARRGGGGPPSLRSESRREVEERSDRKVRQLQILYIQALTSGRGIEMDELEFLDEIEDHEDRIVDAREDAAKMDTRIPVFTEGKRVGEGRRWAPREGFDLTLRPFQPLPKGHWVFVPSIRPNYTNKLVWPDVYVEVEESTLPTFTARVYNIGERRERVAPNKLVGWCEPIDPAHVDPLHDLQALETYEDFRKDRQIVDPQDPVALANHQKLVWEQLREGVSLELTPEQETTLRELSDRYAHIFSTVKGESPPVSKIGRARPIRIDTGEHAPIAQRSYRRSPRQRREIERHVMEMERDGIIRDSQSEWASPVVLAMKKDGSTRFCVNYRALNDVTTKDRYPLPRIDEILDQLGGQAWFTSLDMSAGYWVLPIEEGDKAKTAFISHMGLKEFNVLPFGLTNAPAAYQRAMDCVLAGLVGLNCLAYIDDIIVFSSGFESHIQDLEAILQRLESAGFTVNARKCGVCRKELVYLGHVVTPEGVRPDPTKIDTIAHTPYPKNVRDVRAFLGLVNYYRRYIRDCSVIQAPLSQLCRNPKQGEPSPKFSFSEECKEAWDKLRIVLVTEPVMRHPDFNRRFRIDVDSCADGVGAVLTQVFDDGEHPVAYYSKKFTQDEGKWSSNELEAIGVIKALDHFRPYVWGVDFDLLSDNMTVHLSWLRRQTRGKLARWAARLSEYEGYMTILPRSGRKHGNGDALSRMRKHPSDPPEEGDDCMGLGVSPRREESAELAPTSPLEGRLLLLTPEETDQLTADAELLHRQHWAGDKASQEALWRTEVPFGKIVEEIVSQQGGDSNIQRTIQRIVRLPDQQDRFFRVDGGVLNRWYKPSHSSGAGHWVLVVPRALQSKVLACYHDFGPLQHLGVGKTRLALAPRFWWKGMGEDIKKYVRTCPWCQKFKAVSHRVGGAPMPKVVQGCNKLLSIDIAGPFEHKAGIPLHVLTIVDVFSGYVEVVAIPATRTQDILDVLEDRWLKPHGSPQAIVTDRGAQFESDAFRRWCERRGINKRRTTAYHPQSNSQAERVHRWLRERLSVKAAQTTGEWFEYLTDVVRTHNLSPIEGMGDVSPYLLWYGRRPTLPGDSELGVETAMSTQLPKEELDEIYARLIGKRELERAARSRRQEASAPPPEEFKEGDFVLIKIPKKGKLAPAWDGPWPVVEKITPLLYSVRRRKRGKLTLDTVNVGRLHRFHRRSRVYSVGGLPLGVPPGLVVDQSTIPGAGWGVISQREWPADHKLGTYEGEVLTEAQFADRYPDGTATYVVALQPVGGEQRYVDAVNPLTSNWARFMNAPGAHEEPNVMVDEVEGLLEVRTLRPIVVGEELVWDYGDTYAMDHTGHTSNARVRARHGRAPPDSDPEPAASNAEVKVDVGREVKVDVGRDLTEEERGMIEGLGSARRSSGDHYFLEDEHVLIYDPTFDEEVVVGRVESRDDDDNKYYIWCCGTYLDHLPLYRRKFGFGYLDTSDNRVLYSKPKKATYVPFRRWFSRDTIIDSFTPISKGGGLYVPEVKANAAELVRGLALSLNRGGLSGLVGIVEALTEVPP
jgi:transposase InsO family protein